MSVNIPLMPWTRDRLKNMRPKGATYEEVVHNLISLNDMIENMPEVKEKLNQLNFKTIHQIATSKDKIQE